jgi:hypothetical protein
MATKVFALDFRFKDRNYKLELQPLALRMDGQLIERIEDGSGRRLQESQLKVLRCLLEHNDEYCSIDLIAREANLRAKNPSNAIRAHIYYLRAVLGDSGHPARLIRTREGRQHDGVDTTYGLFTKVEALDHSPVEELKDIKQRSQEDVTGYKVEVAVKNLGFAPTRDCLRHLFGPALVIAPVCAMVLIGVWIILGKPNHPADKIIPVQVGATPESKQQLEALLDYHVRDYKANLTRFNWDCGLQAALIVFTMLLIFRRSDSVKLFDFSIRLSWLHLFVILVMIYLWLDFGFALDGLIWGRLRGVELMKALNIPNMEFQRTEFLDYRFIDGWFLTFIDGHRGESYSGISPGFSAPTAVLLALVLGTLISSAHATVLAIPPIAIRRYVRNKSDRWLSWYYLSPILPLAILVASHIQFVYGGENRNWLHFYIAAVTIPLIALLLWLSVVADTASYPDSVSCLRRRHQVAHKARPAIDADGRTISLIGESLSTSFHVSSLPSMVLLCWTGWKESWFMKLERGRLDDTSVLGRLNIDFGPVNGFHHASVSASVDDGGSRRVIDHLKDTWHFSHQVDEVLAGTFPDLLLIWIGHNNIDWKSKTHSSSVESLDELSEEFIGLYKVQLERLITGALASKKRCALVVFGLISFELFFKARAEAEGKRKTGRGPYPYYETCHKYFVTLQPEYRQRTIELGELFNQKLACLCRQLGEGLLKTDVRLVYSGAMAEARIDNADLLAAADAWHPSASGHRVLADNAYEIARDQAEFLGWTPAQLSGRGGSR